MTNPIIEFMKNAHYPFTFAIDLHTGTHLDGYEGLVAEGITVGELTVRLECFFDAPRSWHAFLGAMTGHYHEGTWTLQLDDAAGIERQVRMVLADRDLAQMSMDAEDEETGGTDYWDKLSTLGAMFDRLAAAAPEDYRLSYVILAEPGMPAHIERMINAHR